MLNLTDITLVVELDENTKTIETKQMSLKINDGLGYVRYIIIIIIITICTIILEKILERLNTGEIACSNRSEGPPYSNNDGSDDDSQQGWDVIY
jgi:hypothetical protein